MAKRRMVSLQIVDTDAFLEMPVGAQLLYFHLLIRADDEGFVGNPKKIMKIVAVNEDDYKVLVAKRFILLFNSGVLVIKHWLIHNTIRMDRFNKTTYQDEKRILSIKTNKSYTDLRQPNGNQLAPQVNINKDKLSKDNISKERETPSHINKSFFSLFEQKKFNEAFNLLSDSWLKKIDEIQPQNKTEVLNEFLKFVSYWTEPNKSGTKVRWEQQTTFEINRRLNTWFDRASTFNKTKQSKTINLDNI